MGEHYSDIVENLFRKKIQDLSNDYWNSYYDMLCKAIQLTLSNTLAYRNSACQNEETDLNLVRQGRTNFSCALYLMGC